MKTKTTLLTTIVAILLLAISFVMVGCNDKSQESIKIHTDFKSTYFINEELDVTDGKIEYTDKNGKTSIIAITSDMITSFSTATAGEREMIITYNGLTTTYPYEVIVLQDITYDSLYYSYSNALTNGDETNDVNHNYIYFIGSSEFYVTVMEQDPGYVEIKQMIIDVSSPRAFVRSIENNKVVYTYSDFGLEIKLTVTSENTLSFWAMIGTEEKTATFTKI